MIITVDREFGSGGRELGKRCHTRRLHQKGYTIPLNKRFMKPVINRFELH